MIIVILSFYTDDILISFEYQFINNLPGRLSKMKKTFIYILFFSYTIMLIRPTVPFLADVIAHTFWYSQHMATVHCENGKYHVHYQFMNEAQKSLPGKSPQNSKTQVFSGDHLASVQKYDLTFHVMMVQDFHEQSA